jgi:hypothetical protein
MFNPLELKKRFVQSQIEKSFSDEIEKAKYQVGQSHPQHPNWVWTEYAPGKFVWKSRNGRHWKNKGGSSDANNNADSRDKVAQKAGFKDYKEMRGYQEYVTAKNLLKKPSMQAKTKQAEREALEKQVAKYEKEHADVIKRVAEKKDNVASKDTKSGDKSDKKKADLPFTGLTKHSQVIDYAKTIDGADFEEINSGFRDRGSKAFRLNYSGGLKLDVDFPNNSEYVYAFKDKNGNSLYEVRSTKETDETDWSVMLNPRKWGDLVKSNISKHISKRKAEQTRYFNLYNRGGKSSYHDKYLDAKYDIERLKRNLDKVDKVLQLS